MNLFILIFLVISYQYLNLHVYIYIYVDGAISSISLHFWSREGEEQWGLPKN